MKVCVEQNNRSFFQLSSQAVTYSTTNAAQFMNKLHFFELIIQIEFFQIFMFIIL